MSKSLHQFVSKIYKSNGNLSNNNAYNVTVKMISEYVHLNKDNELCINTTNMSYQQLIDYLEYIRKLQLEANPHARRHLIKDLERQFKIYFVDWGAELFIAEEAIIETLLTILKKKTDLSKNTVFAGYKTQPGIDSRVNYDLPQISKLFSATHSQYCFTYTKTEFNNLIDLLNFNADLLDYDDIVKYLKKNISGKNAIPLAYWWDNLELNNLDLKQNELENLKSGDDNGNKFDLSPEDEAQADRVTDVILESILESLEKISEKS